jgi:hypothetical protein
MSFLRTWLSGYYNPIQFIEQLNSKPAPHWGIYAALLRGVFDSVLLYLPVTLIGRVPPTPSYLSFLPTEKYYASLVWLGPIVLLAEILFAAVVVHVLLRLLGRHSDIDQIINIIGMSGLVVGAILIPWDWAWFAAGRADQYFLGISHLIIDIWTLIIMTIGFRKILKIPLWLSIGLSIITIFASLPLAIMFMRSPF